MKKSPKSILFRLLTDLHMQEIIGEWHRCIQKKKDPSIFANMYLEVMRDPKNGELRRNACAFLVFADTRDWEEILAELEPALAKAQLKAFNSPSAEIFYMGWKSMVKYAVAEYWNGLEKEAKHKKGKRKTG